jgi:hypothetical protein
LWRTIGNRRGLVNRPCRLRSLSASFA